MNESNRHRPEGHAHGLLGACALAIAVLAPLAPAATLTTLHHFEPSPAPNQPLNHGLVHGGDGSLYGATSRGGSPDNYGTVFRMSASGTVTPLVEFHGPATPLGRSPGEWLVQGGDGACYGVTQDSFDDAATWYYGTVFRMTPDGELTTLVTFDTLAGPAQPSGGLVVGDDGSFYGMTSLGGSGSAGTIFKMTPGGVLTVLVSFNTAGVRGRIPAGALLKAGDGSFYGVTAEGGLRNRGTVFKATPAGEVTTLVDFNGTADPKGGRPVGSLVQGRDGNLYGITREGGRDDLGTAFKLTPNGVLTTLASFGTPASKGYAPAGSLIEGSDGNFYGTTQEGGSYQYGTVFRLTPAGTLATLAHFRGPTMIPREGQNPSGRLLQARDGHFYGMTRYGGTNNLGTIFRLDAELAPVHLNVRRDAGNVVLTWPSAGTTGYFPEHSPILGASPGWTTNGISASDDGTNKSTTLPIGPDPRFFRLRKP